MAKPRKCEVKYHVGNKTAEWFSLGDVSGFLADKKKKCKALASEPSQLF